MKISIIIPSFKRTKLLDLGLWSITQQKISYNLEVIVLNDGIEDDTESICNKYKDKLNIRYIFTGQRNKNGLQPRIPGFAINIGVKQCQGNIIILSCPEIFHLNNAINITIENLLNNNHLLTIPQIMYFDDNGMCLLYLENKQTVNISDEMLIQIQKNPECKLAVQMPFLMGMYKERFMEIGGYDEDFIGYAGDDNDFVHRLLKNGCSYCHTNAKIIHLYHGKRCDSAIHLENPLWEYNWNLFQSRKNIIIRNKNRQWGEIK